MAKLLMTPGRNCGKILNATRILESALSMAGKKCKQQPGYIFLKVLLTNSPFATTRTVKQGSINVMKKVFLPQHTRRMYTLHNFIAKLRGKKRVSVILADQISSAYRNEGRSVLINFKVNCHKSAKLASE